MIGSKALQAIAMKEVVDESHQRQESVIDDLRRRLFEANKTKVFRRSAKEALGQLVGEIIDEVDGRKPIRLSDPNNTELRNSFYVDTMAEKVKKHAAGLPPAPDGTRIAMDKATIADFKAKRQIK